MRALARAASAFSCRLTTLHAYESSPQDTGITDLQDSSSTGEIGHRSSETITWTNQKIQITGARLDTTFVYLRTGYVLPTDSVEWTNRLD